MANKISKKLDQAKTSERKGKKHSEFWNPVPLLEPYRLILSELRDKLHKTREVLEYCMNNSHVSVRDKLDDPDLVRTKSDLLEPLMMIYNSLVAVGDADIANGNLLDVIRQVHVFGMTLMQLDIRQEAARHTEVIVSSHFRSPQRLSCSASHE